MYSGSAKFAPDEAAVVHLAKYLPVNTGPEKDAITELEAVAELVMPGWRDEEVKQQTLRGMTVSNAIPR